MKPAVMGVVSAGRFTIAADRSMHGIGPVEPDQINRLAFIDVLPVS